LSTPLLTDHILYYSGDLPIILSAPHGGLSTPDNITDRTSGVFDQDDFTKELTIDIVEEFFKQTGKYPYAVIADIARTKVDLNRRRELAYEDERAKVVYDTFHSRIQNAEKEIDAAYGKGLYIDIHGQSHPKAYLEFGYLLVNDILALPDSKLQAYQDQTSIKTLSKFSKESFLQQLKGPHSMGSLMCAQGYDSIPSVKLPYSSDDNYFEGAYDTIRYGSLEGGNISGIQIEFPYLGIRDSEENRKKCARTFVEVIRRFMQIHFNLSL
jgi:hypothetical protein